YNAGYSAGVSNLTCVTANGTSGGAQTVDASVTTPSGKTHCHICAAITNPRIANTYVQKGGSTVAWTKTETSRANIFYAHITGLSSGTVIKVHSQRQNTSIATLIGVVALFG
ncbi:MAG TPA: hypothetical protein DCW90_09060, partial [Lachnospiraceae bacterium]|nr:hypothetical protein [Lachnospiraceae bacterium]